MLASGDMSTRPSGLGILPDSLLVIRYIIKIMVENEMKRDWNGHTDYSQVVCKVTPGLEIDKKLDHLRH